MACCTLTGCLGDTMSMWGKTTSIPNMHSHPTQRFWKNQWNVSNRKVTMIEITFDQFCSPSCPLLQWNKCYKGFDAMQVSVINTTTATFSQLLVSSKYKCFQKLSKALQKRGSKDIQLLFLFVCILQCLKPKPGNSGFWRLYLLLGQLGVSGVHWVDNWTSNAFGLPSLPLRQTKSL